MVVITEDLLLAIAERSCTSWPFIFRPTATAAFAGVDIQNLRAGYLSANANDLKSKWATVVPGK